MAKIFLAALIIISLGACGGGGGGGGTDEPASLALQASPANIDTGDRISVEIQMADLSPSGVALKLRYPKQLSYIANSAFLTTDRTSRLYPPQSSAVVDTKKYLVFYISPATLEPFEQGELTLTLVGESAVTEGRIEVDADIDDPAVPNQREFNSKDPKFEAQEAVDIRIRGETAAATPTAQTTPSGTPAGTATPTPTGTPRS